MRGWTGSLPVRAAAPVRGPGCGLAAFPGTPLIVPGMGAGLHRPLRCRAQVLVAALFALPRVGAAVVGRWFVGREGEVACACHCPDSACRAWPFLSRFGMRACRLPGDAPDRARDGGWVASSPALPRAGSCCGPVRAAARRRGRGREVVCGQGKGSGVGWPLPGPCLLREAAPVRGSGCGLPACPRRARARDGSRLHYSLCLLARRFLLRPCSRCRALARPWSGGGLWAGKQEMARSLRLRAGLGARLTLLRSGCWPACAGPRIGRVPVGAGLGQGRGRVLSFPVARTLPAARSRPCPGPGMRACRLSGAAAGPDAGLCGLRGILCSFSGHARQLAGAFSVWYPEKQGVTLKPRAYFSKYAVYQRKYAKMLKF